jgi:acyl-[acyl-carrier-protein]-phospholipid O-acyltransferase / long-chain-fatty-acid--[acyl-carrier-protein] ligase
MTLEPQSLFSGRRFVPLFMTQGLAAFTDNALRYAITILVVYQLAAQTGTDGGTFVAAGTALFILPYFLFSSIAGEFADKRDKAMLARRLKLFQLIIMAAGAASLWMGNLWFYLVILFLAGTEAAFFSPVKYGLLPQHLKKQELVEGNGLIEMTTFVAVLAGTLFGGGLVLESFGIEIIAVAIVGLSIIAWRAALAIPDAPPQIADQPLALNPVTGTFRILRDAFKGRRDVLRTMLGISWFWFTGALMLTVFPPFTKDLLGGNAAVANLFVAAFTVGIAAGSLTANSLLKGDISARLVPFAALLMAAGLFDLFVASPGPVDSALPLIGITDLLSTLNGWRILVDLIIISFAGGIFAVPLNALLQDKAKPARRARILAANNILNALFMTTSSAIAAIAFAKGFTAKELFLLLAIGNLAAGILAFTFLKQDSFRLAARGFFRLFWQLKIAGLEHLAATRGAVVVANHQSALDPLLLASFLNERPLVALTPSAQAKSPNKYLARFADITVIDPENPLSIRPLVAALKRGRKVIMLPEPHSTTTGGLMKLEETPAMLAHMAGVPVLPARIDGAETKRGSRLPQALHRKSGPVRLTFRPAVTLDAGDAKGAELREKLGLALYSLMTRVAFETGPTNETLIDALLRAMHDFGRGTEIVEDVERKPLTYGRLLTGVFVLGRALAKRTPGQKHVGVLLPSTNACLVTFFGLLAYGRIPAMLNYATGGVNMSAALAAAEADTVITSHRFVTMGKLEADVAQLATRARIIYLDDVRPTLGTGAKLLGLLQSHFPRLALKLSGAVTDPDETAVVLFTSGSEGVPKGVALTHRAINANRNQASARIDFTPADRMMNPLPMFHAFGLMAGTLLPLLAGVRTFFYPSPLHYKVVPELCYATDATILIATDTFLMGYARNAHPHDFHRMRLVVAGAERVKKETRDLWFERFGLRILEGYGATECSPVLSVNTPMFNKTGTTGRIFDGLQWRLEPVEGIPQGGRLFVKGPNVMKGYLRADNPGVIEPPADGWYDTGDIVDIDAQGFITILGRAKRFSKVAGEMISLTAVENAIMAVLPDHAHAVVAVPDAKKGEQLMLITTQADLDRKSLQEALRGKVSELMVPRHVLQVEELPLLGTGKTDYVTLGRMAREAVAK